MIYLCLQNNMWTSLSQTWPLKSLQLTTLFILSLALILISFSQHKLYLHMYVGESSDHRKWLVSRSFSIKEVLICRLIHHQIRFRRNIYSLTSYRSEKVVTFFNEDDPQEQWGIKRRIDTVCSFVARLTVADIEIPFQIKFSACFRI